MARRPIRPADIQSPDRILSNLLKDYVDGNLDDNRVLYKAAVVAVDHVGGTLEQEPALNPPGSIKARIITDAYDRDTPLEDLPVFWPMFPYDLMPVKENEFVYVIFEDPDTKEHGIWLSRIPEPNNIHNYNITPGSKKYVENPDNELSEGSAANKVIQDTDEEPDSIEISPEFTQETDVVPQFQARVGDRVIHGSNNTAIILSRDRVDTVDSGAVDAAGTIDVVAGRKQENDVSMADDDSRIYITMLSDVDKNFEIVDPKLPGDSSATAAEPAGEDSHIVAKSNQIRLVARAGFKINVGEKGLTLAIGDDGSLSIETAGTVDIKADGDTTIESPNVVVTNDTTALGAKGASESMIQGTTFMQEFAQVLNTVATDLGAAGVTFGVPSATQFPGSAAALSAFAAQLNNFLSQKHKIDE